MFFLFEAIFSAVSATRPRADVAYCIHSLARRLAKTHNWAVSHLLLNHLDRDSYPKLISEKKKKLEEEALDFMSMVG